MNFRNAIPAAVFAATLLVSGCGSGSGADDNKAVSQTPDQTAPSNTAADNASGNKEDFKGAIDQYRQYVVEECDEFVKLTGEFTAAVKSGDIEKAKSLYAPARMHYERIEPIAEALGDLDPNIDARENDVEEQEWRGFHRIEKALWEQKTTDGSKSMQIAC